MNMVMSLVIKWVTKMDQRIVNIDEMNFLLAKVKPMILAKEDQDRILGIDILSAQMYPKDILSNKDFVEIFIWSYSRIPSMYYNSFSEHIKQYFNIERGRYQQVELHCPIHYNGNMDNYIRDKDEWILKNWSENY